MHGISVVDLRGDAHAPSKARAVSLVVPVAISSAQIACQLWARNYLPLSLSVASRSPPAVSLFVSTAPFAALLRQARFNMFVARPSTRSEEHGSKPTFCAGISCTGFAPASFGSTVLYQ
jgi:hypothetical protein